MRCVCLVNIWQKSVSSGDAWKMLRLRAGSRRLSGSDPQVDGPATAKRPFDTAERSSSTDWQVFDNCWTSPKKTDFAEKCTIKTPVFHYHLYWRSSLYFTHLSVQIEWNIHDMQSLNLAENRVERTPRTNRNTFASRAAQIKYKNYK